MIGSSIVPPPTPLSPPPLADVAVIAVAAVVAFLGCINDDDNVEDRGAPLGKVGEGDDTFCS